MDEAATPSARERLTALLAPPDADCVDCLDSACDAALSDCSDRDSCLEYMTCLLDEPSPASAAHCRGKLRPSPQDVASSDTLGECWQTCSTTCDGGRDFACAGKYVWPVPPSGSITLTQTLGDLFDLKVPFAGAEVSVCPPLFDCDEPLAQATTDDDGHYSVTIEIHQSPPSIAGFRGYRRVVAEEIMPHRLVLSMPVLTDRVESTRLLRRSTTDALLQQSGVGDDVNALLMQVFDCRGVGAEGVTLELNEGALAHYGVGTTFDQDGTRAAQEGSLGVTGLRSREYNEIKARDADGNLVAQTAVWVPGDELVLLGLYPSARVEP